MRKQWKTVLGIVAGLAFGIGMANAGTMSLSSVQGNWTGLDETTATRVNGIGTNSVHWGTPATKKGQSGYSFASAVKQDIQSGVEFDLGLFTHDNRTIKTDTSITGAHLKVAINLVIDGVDRAITTAFDFTHLETLNKPRRGALCADGGANKTGANVSGCADRVSLVQNNALTNTFVIDGMTYILEVTGLLYNGQTLTDFWTREKAANSAVLRARLTAVAPPVSPVPLPAGGSLLVVALAAFGVAKWRRRSV